jgi:hypothetical protein
MAACPLPSLEQVIAGDLIAEDLAQSPGREPHVELAIYGFADPTRLARLLDACCLRLLGSHVRGALFYQSSVGAVAGVELTDGRRVVLKAYQPDRSFERLQEVARLQRCLAQHGCLAPPVLAGPEPLGRGHLLIEAHVARGETRDGHEPAIRAAIARSLHAVSTALSPLVASSSLPPHALALLPPDRLWPTPHSKLFDFEATLAGAEEIDALARLARPRMLPVGAVVLGHSDWRAEHLRFEGQRPVAAFDWDSLCKSHEPELVGFIAHGFCADWSRSGHVQAPTLAEARAFVDEYEAARGTAFTAAERRALGAAFAYSVAYSSRCGHAYGKHEREKPGTFHHLLASHGEQLLDL